MYCLLVVEDETEKEKENMVCKKKHIDEKKIDVKKNNNKFQFHVHVCHGKHLI